MSVEQIIVDALADRERKLLECPIRKGRYRGGDAPCSKCHATTAGPCWVNVEADAVFVDMMKDLVA